MSIKVMTAVWDHSKCKGSELLLMLAIADFAHDDGAGAFPSIATLAQKTRLSERHVQRMIKSMSEGKKSELEVDFGAGPSGTHRYRVRLERYKEGGDNLSPPDTGKGDNRSAGGRQSQLGGVTSTAEGGDIAVSPDPLEIPTENLTDNHNDSPAPTAGATGGPEPDPHQGSGTGAGDGSIVQASFIPETVPPDHPTTQTEKKVAAAARRAWHDAIGKDLHVFGARAEVICQLLQGVRPTSKGEAKYNVPDEYALTDPQEVARFAAWYNAQTGAGVNIPTSPEKLQDWIIKWRKGITSAPRVTNDQQQIWANEVEYWRSKGAVMSFDLTQEEIEDTRRRIREGEAAKKAARLKEQGNGEIRT